MAFLFILVFFIILPYYPIIPFVQSNFCSVEVR